MTPTTRKLIARAEKALTKLGTDWRTGKPFFIDERKEVDLVKKLLVALKKATK